EDFSTNRVLGLLQADVASVETDAVDDNLHLVDQARHLAERHHQSHDVAQAGKVELRDEQNMVSGLERYLVERAVALRKVDHQMRERRLHQANDSLQVVR